jgi:hypothetical protein
MQNIRQEIPEKIAQRRHCLRKVSFNDRDKAQEAADRTKTNHGTLHVYKCLYYPHYHVGHAIR